MRSDRDGARGAVWSGCAWLRMRKRCGAVMSASRASLLVWPARGGDGGGPGCITAHRSQHAWHTGCPAVPAPHSVR
eukprot:4682997-Prymnesium_polylepis.2